MQFHQGGGGRSETSRQSKLCANIISNNKGGEKRYGVKWREQQANENKIRNYSELGMKERGIPCYFLLRTITVKYIYLCVSNV